MQRVGNHEACALFAVDRQDASCRDRTHLAETGDCRVGLVAGRRFSLGVFCTVNDDWRTGEQPLNLHDEAEEILAPARLLQACARGLLVRRCLLPPCVLHRELTRACKGCLLGLTVSPLDLYLRPVASCLSFVYCEKRTRFVIVDALLSVYAARNPAALVARTKRQMPGQRAS